MNLFDFHKFNKLKKIAKLFNKTGESWEKSLRDERKSSYSDIKDSQRKIFNQSFNDKLENLLKNSFKLQKENFPYTLSASFQKNLKLKIRNLGSTEKDPFFSPVKSFQFNLLGLKLLYTRLPSLFTNYLNFNKLMGFFLLGVSIFLLIFFIIIYAPQEQRSNLNQSKQVGYPLGIRFLEKEQTQKSKQQEKKEYFHNFIYFYQNREEENKKSAYSPSMKSQKANEDSLRLRSFDPAPGKTGQANPRLPSNPVFWHVPGMINQSQSD